MFSSWYRDLSPFEITVLALLVLIWLSLLTAIHWLSSIAKILAANFAHLRHNKISELDISSAIADGIESYDKRREKEAEGDLPSGKDFYGPDWRPPITR